MSESNTNNQELELTIDMFNVSGEFEDIEFLIDETKGDVQMVAASRRC